VNATLIITLNEQNSTAGCYYVLQVEAESLPELSSKYNVVAVPTCVLLKVSFVRLYLVFIATTCG